MAAVSRYLVGGGVLALSLAALWPATTAAPAPGRPGASSAPGVLALASDDDYCWGLSQSLYRAERGTAREVEVRGDASLIWVAPAGDKLIYRAADRSLRLARIAEGSIAGKPKPLTRVSGIDYLWWSADGSRAAVSHWTQNRRGLMTISLARSRVRTVALPRHADIASVAVGPEGTTAIAYTVGSSLRVATVTENGRLRAVATLRRLNYTPLALSSDGRRLAYVLPGQRAIAVVDLGPGKVRRLAAAPPGTEITQMSWTPASLRLLFAYRQQTGQRRQTGFGFVSPLGADRRLVRDGQALAWSPGRVLAATVGSGAARHGIRLLDETGRLMRRIAAPVEVEDAVWTADTRWLLVLDDRGRPRALNLWSGRVERYARLDVADNSDVDVDLVGVRGVALPTAAVSRTAVAADC